LLVEEGEYVWFCQNCDDVIHYYFVLFEEKEIEGEGRYKAVCPVCEGLLELI